MSGPENNLGDDPRSYLEGKIVYVEGEFGSSSVIIHEGNFYLIDLESYKESSSGYGIVLNQVKGISKILPTEVSDLEEMVQEAIKGNKKDIDLNLPIVVKNKN